jgi:cellulose synthase/poly-beta-1,6-N-acetylglucosamine synthase-like glycosyltransferase
MEFILQTIFWTLALYGLFEIIKNIIYISTYTSFKSDGVYVIIAVKNQEDKIEGFLRSTLFKLLYGREEYLKNIIVVDLKSEDKTKEIAKKLSKEYECLKVISWKECKEIMDSVDNS